jgi:hypothetical protein
MATYQKIYVMLLRCVEIAAHWVTDMLMVAMFLHLITEKSDDSKTQILLQCNRRNPILSGSCYTRGLWHV